MKGTVFQKSAAAPCDYQVNKATSPVRFFSHFLILRTPSTLAIISTFIRSQIIHSCFCSFFCYFSFTPSFSGWLVRTFVCSQTPSLFLRPLNCFVRSFVSCTALFSFFHFLAHSIQPVFRGITAF